MAPKSRDPENIFVTLETLERAEKARSGSEMREAAAGHMQGSAGSQDVCCSSGFRCKAKGVQSSQRRTDKESHGRLRRIGLLGLLQVRSGKAMKKRSVAGAG